MVQGRPYVMQEDVCVKCQGLRKLIKGVANRGYWVLQYCNPECRHQWAPNPAAELKLPCNWKQDEED